MHRILTTFAVMLLLGSLTAAGAVLEVTDLRCEYRCEPLGIDELAPRLSWKLESAERGQLQRAYQVLAADSKEALDADHGTLWDSGKVISDQSHLVTYAGAPLQSRQYCYWKVRVWNDADTVSKWSDVSWWSMGLLDASDWGGKWIGLDEEDNLDQARPLALAQWIWWPEEGGQNAALNAAIGTRYFRGESHLPTGKSIQRATAYFTADNQFKLWINGAKAASGADYNIALPVDVTSHLRPGRNVLAVEAVNLGEANNPAGLIGAVVVEWADGTQTTYTTGTSWQVSHNVENGWHAADYDDGQWHTAAVLGEYGMDPWKQVTTAVIRNLSARYLRREFKAPQAVRRAVVHLCGLGHFMLEINGKRVGYDMLVPALTEYTKRAMYLTYDVTEYLQPGANAVGVILGNGRYYAPRRGIPTYGYPKMLFDMRVEYKDGTVTDLVSDESWKLFTDGPIRENNEYDGERYDARMKMRGWILPGYDDSSWRNAAVVAAPGGVLAAQMNPPIRVIETLKTLSVKEVKPGVFIYDLGQNMVGWCRLRMHGPRGTQVRLRHAETLQDDGTLYVANLRGAKCEDNYTLAGDEGGEVYEPRFVFHGFRYVEVTGYPGTPGLESIEGRVVHDDVDRVGHFETSNALLNQLHNNIVWGIRGNYRSIPTDCPQRDERQGWLGDRSEECRGESYVYNIAPLYSKWMLDIEDGQKETGSVSDVNPPYWPLYNDNVTWPSTFIIAPGMLYEQYGDLRPIERRYDAMKRWIEYMRGFIEDGLMPRDNYGDWCVPPESPELIHSNDPARKTSKEVLGTCYFQYDLQLMARYARLLGKKEDETRYTELAEQMKTAFNNKLFHAEENLYDNGTQTSSILPLAFHIAPEDRRPAIFARLVDNIVHKTDSHIGTGLIGGQWLMRTLSDHGRADLAYTLSTQTTYPSWGYMVDQGATTIWELWNGNTADPAMNSGNHVMLVGDLLTWFYEYLAGIRPTAERPGFHRIEIKPYVLGDLTEVRASVETPYGIAASHWVRSGDALTLEVVIPTNCTARIGVPSLGNDTPTITEGGQTVWRDGAACGDVRGIASAQAQDEWVFFETGSGNYRFQVSP